MVETKQDADAASVRETIPIVVLTAGEGSEVATGGAVDCSTDGAWDTDGTSEGWEDGCKADGATRGISDG